jgi:hypothetical protein
MSTNYYRIPKPSEVRFKYLDLVEQINGLDIWSSNNIRNDFRTIERGFDNLSPWDVFLEDMKIHIGKRSSGWKFLWNFQDGKFYTSKEELLKFIRSGRVVNEYGEIQNTEEFIKMALEWGQPDGCVLNQEYIDKHKSNHSSYISSYYDKEVDGLRVSSHTEFS